MRLIDADTLKKALDEQMNFEENCRDSVFDIIDNAPTITPTFGIFKELCCSECDECENAYNEGYEFGITTQRPQGECKDCDNCEDKAKQYSIGFQDGYLLGGFQLAELRRWLIAQGYSEGTVDDKIEDFGNFVKRIREDEG